MHFLYVDESGDPGYWDPNQLPGLNPSPHFILAGLAISEDDWRNYLTACIEMRRGIRERFGLLMREELRGSQLIYPRHNRAIAALKGGRKARVGLYREVLDGVANRLERARFIHIYVDKR